MIKTTSKNFPNLRKFVKYLLGKASIVEIFPISFVGWQMATGTSPPWQSGPDNEISFSFNSCNKKLLSLIDSKQIKLSQFNQNNVLTEVDALSWRHYIVYWSVKLAMKNTASTFKELAEFGVCDGLTAFFASDAIKNDNSTFYLYDAWEGMKEDLLLATEKTSTGSYSYLSIQNTKKNLALSEHKNFIFNQGYIPQVFQTVKTPTSLVWIHIDLNSSMPTIATLDLFWDKLQKGGLVLLDDFGWSGYEDTRKSVEFWVKDKDCTLLHMPTGQALIFK